MTVGDQLSQGVVEIQDAWTSLNDTWMQTVQDLLGSVPADLFGFFHPDLIVGQMFDLGGQSMAINLDLLAKLIGASSRGAAAERVAETVPAPIELAPPALAPVEFAPPVPAPIELAPPEVHQQVAQPVTRPVPAETYSRVSKADLQKVLSERNLPNTGTVKELRHRLIEADRQKAD